MLKQQESLADPITDPIKKKDWSAGGHNDN